jgi:prolyl-tRNA editing enzyme YbaK/EbsC (Cys-tRNA(Pro) deacylase)
MNDLRAQEVQRYLSREGLEPKNFTRQTQTSAAAAEVVGCTVGEIAKSILMLIGKQPVMIVTSGDTRVKSGRLKEATGLSGRVCLPVPDDVLYYTGYAPGAVSPFLLPDNLPVLLDNSLQRYEVVYPAAGSCSSAVSMSFSRLQDLCRGRIVDVCDIQE